MNGRVVACVGLDKEGCVRMRSNRASVTKRLHENVVSGRKSVDVFKLSIFPKKTPSERRKIRAEHTHI